MVNEENGKEVDIPHPVEKLRDSEGEFDPHLEVKNILRKEKQRRERNLLGTNELIFLFKFRGHLKQQKLELGGLLLLKS